MLVFRLLAIVSVLICLVLADMRNLLLLLTEKPRPGDGVEIAQVRSKSKRQKPSSCKAIT